MTYQKIYDLLFNNILKELVWFNEKIQMYETDVLMKLEKIENRLIRLEENIKYNCAQR